MRRMEKERMIENWGKRKKKEREGNKGRRRKEKGRRARGKSWATKR